MLMNEMTIVLLVAPLALIQFVLMIINIINWSNKKKTKTLTKMWWIVIIVLGNLIGNVIYMLVEGGRDDSNQD